MKIAINLGLDASEAGSGDPILIAQSDTFDGASLDTSKWTEVSAHPAGSNTQASGCLVQAVTTSAAGYDVVRSVGTFSLLSKAAFIKLVEPLNSPQDGADTAFRLTDNASGDFINFTADKLNGLLFAGHSTGGSSSYDAGVALTYPVWLRMRESAGTVYWDTAPNTASNPPIESDWVNAASLSLATLGWTPSNVYVQLQTGHFQVVASAPTAPTRWDGFNTTST